MWFDRPQRASPGLGLLWIIYYICRNLKHMCHVPGVFILLRDSMYLTDIDICDIIKKINVADTWHTKRDL